jgi:drug/metabolite transporter (DMT)-like permease
MTGLGLATRFEGLIMSNAPTPAAPSARPMTTREWVMLLGLSLLWGASFFFNGIAVKELPTLTIVLCRLFLAALILLAVLRLSGQALPRSPEVWLAFFGMGFLNNVIPFNLIVWGQGHIASGVASILNATTPLFTVLVAHFLTRDEKMTPGRIVGVLLGLAGVAIMVGGEALKTLGVNVLAQLACIAAAISYAFAGVFGRRFRALDITPLQTATGQISASSLMMLPLVAWVDRPWMLAMPSTPTLLALVGSAALATALAYVLFFRILATAGAANISLVTFLVPISAILLGIAFLGESLLLKHFIGIALIGAGLAAIDGRLWRRFRR